MYHEESDTPAMARTSNLNEELGMVNVIYERLAQEGQSFKDVTLGHLEEFAAEGLRTLCCAVSNIPNDVYNDWQATYHKASTAINERERKVEEAANLIENNLHLLGATAIEDKLQEGVPETIALLMLAFIYGFNRRQTRNRHKYRPLLQTDLTFYGHHNTERRKFRHYAGSYTPAFE
ncbi:Phospholipid-transporting ATPase IA [Eumeta japonica]|uniref:Phospholipid-transporting ATPase IA n=1 Tax=Eumeta variegata TaxID=151549 RepID=A0A4C1TUC5_EUMVA|nr:Phospholipid-transporting ATPase IA [Eumeta japonica]